MKIMIERINKGVDDSRVVDSDKKRRERPYFVNYILNGQQYYEWYHLPYQMYQRFEEIQHYKTMYSE